ncbi:hypothetical protein DFP72DRAFT_1041849 [Ephemerocybe angulata]|uniref:Uncharacterized protein n=1 Tax=Ephemerocybe angulata TaxID=980116 RepID=A0A8H6I9Z7_9AGAR|nr:hypothetical protein DFP72DRAFT_1041849 [Tulosesus angulatus]
MSCVRRLSTANTVLGRKMETSAPFTVRHEGGVLVLGVWRLFARNRRRLNPEHGGGRRSTTKAPVQRRRRVMHDGDYAIAYYSRTINAPSYQRSNLTAGRPNFSKPRKLAHMPHCTAHPLQRHSDLGCGGHANGTFVGRSGAALGPAWHEVESCERNRWLRSRGNPRGGKALRAQCPLGDAVGQFVLQLRKSTKSTPLAPKNWTLTGNKYSADARSRNFVSPPLFLTKEMLAVGKVGRRGLREIEAFTEGHPLESWNENDVTRKIMEPFSNLCLDAFSFGSKLKGGQVEYAAVVLVTNPSGSGDIDLKIKQLSVEDNGTITSTPKASIDMKTPRFFNMPSK